MSISPQRSLDTTAQSGITIARGVLQAETSDNIQPLAILACERFGNIIAVSIETRRKMEHGVVPIPPPAVLSFLQVTVGFAANDSVARFGRSLAGLHFLGLICSLVSVMDTFNSGLAVHAMLEESAADKTLLPTEVTRIVIETSTSFAAWTAAFTKWCLGIPPSIAHADGTVGLDQPGSIVVINIIQKGHARDISTFKVITHSSIGTLSELVAGPGSSPPIFGMVRLSTYGNLLLNKLGLNHGHAKQAMEKAIPYALRQVLQKLEFWNSPLDYPRSNLKHPNYQIDKVRGQKLSPLPGERTVGMACALLFSATAPPDLRSLDPRNLYYRLPQARVHTQNVTSQSKEFLRKLAILFANILALLVTRDPGRIQHNLANALILNRCEHPPDTKLTEPDPAVRFISPLIDSEIAKTTGDHGQGTELEGGRQRGRCRERRHARGLNVVDVVAGDGNDEMRSFALSDPLVPTDLSFEFQSLVILRKEACLGCCLKLAREVGSKVVIL
ncbi:Putative protein of unknown function [Podospora comata]|uniref:Uncharacterized protein n=1 Tax=Podospora comata TaxID=48703 RepID=A0ABY6SIP8_PODCO|nr:Putative protein of unknown function [Podospora comata]